MGYSDRLETDIRHRDTLLRRHVSVLNAFNGDEGARFAASLVNAVSKADTTSQRLNQLADHLIKLDQISTDHQRATSALAMAKLNASYLRSRQRVKDIDAEANRARKERDEALAKVQELETKLATLDRLDHSASPSVYASTLVTPFSSQYDLAAFPQPPVQRPQIAISVFSASDTDSVSEVVTDTDTDDETINGDFEFHVDGGSPDPQTTPTIGADDASPSSDSPTGINSRRLARALRSVLSSRNRSSVEHPLPALPVPEALGRLRAAAGSGNLHSIALSHIDSVELETMLC